MPPRSVVTKSTVSLRDASTIAGTAIVPVPSKITMAPVPFGCQYALRAWKRLWKTRQLRQLQAGQIDDCCRRPVPSFARASSTFGGPVLLRRKDHPPRRFAPPLPKGELDTLPSFARCTVRLRRASTTQNQGGASTPCGRGRPWKTRQLREDHSGQFLQQLFPVPGSWFPVDKENTVSLRDASTITE